MKISGITVISHTNELEGETMDTYIEIHKPATEKNGYFLVLDEHDNFENDFNEEQLECYRRESI